MLDTYIIDRIRRDRDHQRRDRRIPLHIEDRRPPGEHPSDGDPGATRREPRRDERGSTIIDYRL